MKPQPVLDDNLTFGLLIEPLDPLLFRDGRPFGAADLARTLDAPPPQALAGMLQTHLMRFVGLSAQEYHRAVGNGGLSPEQQAVRVLACRGPWYAWTGKDGEGNGKAGAERCEIKDVFVPAPATLVFEDKEEERLQILWPVEDFEKVFPGWAKSFHRDGPGNGGQGNLLPLLCKGDKLNVQPVDKHFLGSKALKEFLNGREPCQKALIRMVYDPDREPESGDQPAGLFCHESRTGLAIGADTLTAEEGLLYDVKKLRLAPHIVFYAEISLETGAEDPKRGDLVKGLKAAPDLIRGLLRKAFPDTGGDALPFGGEGGRVRVRLLDRTWNWKALEPDWSSKTASDADANREAVDEDAEAGTQTASKYFFSLLIAPVIFRAESRHSECRDDKSAPAAWDPGDCLCRLRAAAVPRPMALSGWSYETDEGMTRAGGHPRPTRQAVPAGAVYFWERGKNWGKAKNSGSKTPVPFLHQIAEAPSDRAKGFGMALKGVWPVKAAKMESRND